MNDWKREQIFHSGDLFFAKLEHDLSKSKTSIELETYIFHLDPLGQRVFDRLRAAAARGVLVRVLVDGVGTLGYAQDLVRELHQVQVQARIFHPLPWKLNRRNHRKVCVIDQTIAYLGGMNISACHLKCYSGTRTWRDTAVRVVGLGARTLTAAFDRIWESQSLTHPIQRFKLRRIPFHRLIKLNDTWRRRKNYHREILIRLQRATSRIWITTPYFVPEFSLTRALRRAAERGVDVKILLPKRVDVWMMNWINRTLYSLFLSAGVRIFEYRPSMLHAKVTLIDDWITVGSSNQNYRSWRHDLEVDLVISQPRSKAALCTQFLRDLQVSQEVVLTQWRKRSWVQTILEWVISLLKYWA